MEHSDIDLAERVLAFAKHEIPPPRPNNISLETDLRTDLRILWEDAGAMLATFFLTFKVDRGDFDFGRYFPNEGGLLWNLAAKLSGKSRPTAAPKKLTVRMLVRAAEVGTWHSEVIEGSG